MESGTLGSVVGAVLGLAGGIIGAYVGAKSSKVPRERGAVMRAVIATLAATGLAVIAGLGGPVVLRVIAVVLLAIIVFLVNLPLARGGRETVGEEGRKQEYR